MNKDTLLSVVALLSSRGLSLDEIGRLLGVSTPTAYRYRNDAIERGMLSPNPVASLSADELRAAEEFLGSRAERTGEVAQFLDRVRALVAGQSVTPLISLRIVGNEKPETAVFGAIRAAFQEGRCVGIGFGSRLGEILAHASGPFPRTLDLVSLSAPMPTEGCVAQNTSVISSKAGYSPGFRVWNYTGLPAVLADRAHPAVLEFYAEMRARVFGTGGPAERLDSAIVLVTGRGEGVGLWDGANGPLGREVEFFRTVCLGDVGGILVKDETHAHPPTSRDQIEQFQTRRWTGWGLSDLLRCKERATRDAKQNDRLGVIGIALDRRAADTVAAALWKGWLSHLVASRELVDALTEKLDRW